MPSGSYLHNCPIHIMAMYFILHLVFFFLFFLSLVVSYCYCPRCESMKCPFMQTHNSQRTCRLTLSISKLPSRSCALAHLRVWHWLHGTGVWLRLTQQSRHLVSWCERTQSIWPGGDTNQSPVWVIVIYHKKGQRALSVHLTCLFQAKPHCEPGPPRTSSSWGDGMICGACCICRSQIKERGIHALATTLTSNKSQVTDYCFDHLSPPLTRLELPCIYSKCPPSHSFQLTLYRSMS